VVKSWATALFLLLLIFNKSFTYDLKMGIDENIALLRKEIPQFVKIVAVSKTMPVAVIQEAYNAGQRVFGENRVQEMTEKRQMLPSDIEWHLIGHLQTNKVKYVVPFVQVIHSVDSLKLLSEINREAAKVKRQIDCLLQIRIAREDTKFGLSFTEAAQMLDSGECNDFQNIKITGLMGMATYSENTKLIKEEFLQLARYFNEMKAQWFSNISSFKELSIGMSGDYKLAIEAGSTMVRIGSLIFGERNYNN
jgi:pyridoxal phosphate enzyme (YggS family)